MDRKFWEVRILETKIGKSNASIAVVEKEDPVGVKFGTCVKGRGSSLFPKYEKSETKDNTTPATMQRFNTPLTCLSDLKFWVSIK